jgi:hypothetical protein
MNRSRPLFALDPDFGTLDGAPSLTFDCPICTGPRAHSILVTFGPPSRFPSGAIWQLLDGSLDTCTVTPSIDLTAPVEYPPEWTPEMVRQAEANRCTFHGFVTNGMVTW